MGKIWGVRKSYTEDPVELDALEVIFYNDMRYINLRFTYLLTYLLTYLIVVRLCEET